MRRALRYISLLLLPTLVPKSVSGTSRARPNADAALDLRGAEPVLQPYLAFVGPPPLRIRTQAPPPDLTVRPPAAAPPNPTASPADAPAASAHVADAHLDPKSSPAAAPAAPQAAEALAASKPDDDAPVPTKAPPPAILPDDTHPAIRPEDFLPYFQIPGSGKPGEVNLLLPPSLLRGAPAAAPIAPSSATYTQSK